MTVDSQRILVPLILAVWLAEVSSARFYRLPPVFKLTSEEVDHVTTNSVWACFANAESYDPEWTHFYFDASSSRCSLRGGLVSFDFMNYWPMGTAGAPLPGNFYVKDVAGRLATVDGCPAETVLRDLVCALPEPLPGHVDCSALESLVQITSANDTSLTNAFFRGKCSEYGGSLYSTTSPYRQSVISVIWNGTLTISERTQQAAEKLDVMADDDDPNKEHLLAFPVGGWGTICDFLACAKQRFPSAAITPKNCPGSSATGTIATPVAASTSIALTWTTVTGTAASSVATKTTATTTKFSAATTTASSSTASTRQTTTASSSTSKSSSRTAPATSTSTPKATTTASRTSTSTSTTTTPSTTPVPVLCGPGLFTFPDQYRLVPAYDATSKITAGVASIEACASQASGTQASGFVTYDVTSRICQYLPLPMVNGYIYGTSNERSAFFQGKDLNPPTALNSSETEVCIMKKVYGTSECPQKATLSGEFCMPTEPTDRWGNYLGGRETNGKLYVLTKSTVIKSFCYTCDTDISVRMTFGGQWFCYSVHAITNPSYDTIKQNACKNLVAGSSVVKFTDKQKECGFLGSMPDIGTAYVGIVLPQSVAKSAAAFKYYDGGNTGPLTWLAKRPNNDTAYNLVYCDKNGYVVDALPIAMKTLICKKPASKKATCPVV